MDPATLVEAKALVKEVGNLNVSQLMAVFILTWPIVRSFLKKTVKDSVNTLAKELHAMTTAMNNRITAVENDVKELKNREVPNA